jgi:hypothetical protein
MIEVRIPGMRVSISSMASRALRAFFSRLWRSSGSEEARVRHPDPDNQAVEGVARNSVRRGSGCSAEGSWGRRTGTPYEIIDGSARA